MTTTRCTNDESQIRQWAEARGARPVIVGLVDGESARLPALWLPRRDDRPGWTDCRPLRWGPWFRLLHGLGLGLRFHVSADGRPTGSADCRHEFARWSCVPDGHVSEPTASRTEATDMARAH